MNILFTLSSSHKNNAAQKGYAMRLRMESRVVEMSDNLVFNKR